MRSRPTYWDKVRKELRPKFALAGLLETCELRWEGCLIRKDGTVPKPYQTFAHSLRRNAIDSYKKQGKPGEYDAKMREVIRACTECHKNLDARKRPETYDIVIDVIKNRKKPVK